jgi:hypothetical protein
MQPFWRRSIGPRQPQDHVGIALSRLAQILGSINDAMRRRDEIAALAVWPPFCLAALRQRRLDRGEGFGGNGDGDHAPDMGAGLESASPCATRIVATAQGRRFLHDNVAGALQMSHDPIGDNRGHVFIRVVDPFPA